MSLQGLPHWVWALLLSALWLGGTARVVWRVWRQRRLTRGTAAAVPEVLIAYASQTGFAEQLARHSASTLRAGGLDVLVLPLTQVRVELLSDPGLTHALFVVSTYGEGDPPDQAAAFARTVLAHPAQLPQLGFAVLALGDSSYRQFCGFGRLLDAWLVASGAQPLAPRIDVDNADPAALEQWQTRLQQWGGVQQSTPWHPPELGDWQLLARHCLNPGSPGVPAFLLKLQPVDPTAGALAWQAGDLVEIQPPLPPGESATPTRRYSIASISAEGAAWLLVRQQVNADGRPGWCSGWLTDRLSTGQPVRLRVLANPGFRLAASAAQPLILIGNGTGLAGLRALLRQRVDIQAGRNWLLFGERSPQHDRWCEDELRQWQADGLLTRVDRIFSRGADQHPAGYVQDLLHSQAAALRSWLDDGAHLHVCGSLRGMAPAVHAALESLLGVAGVDALVAEGRYRRDVY